MKLLQINIWLNAYLDLRKKVPTYDWIWKSCWYARHLVHQTASWSSLPWTEVLGQWQTDRGPGRRCSSTWNWSWGDLSIWLGACSAVYGWEALQRMINWALSTWLGACSTDYWWPALQQIISGPFPPYWDHIQQIIGRLLSSAPNMSMVKFTHSSYLIVNGTFFGDIVGTRFMKTASKFIVNWNWMNFCCGSPTIPLSSFFRFSTFPCMQTVVSSTNSISGRHW